MKISDNFHNSKWNIRLIYKLGETGIHLLSELLVLRIQLELCWYWEWVDGVVFGLELDTQFENGGDIVWYIWDECCTGVVVAVVGVVIDSLLVWNDVNEWLRPGDWLIACAGLDTLILLVWKSEGEFVCIRGEDAADIPECALTGDADDWFTPIAPEFNVLSAPLIGNTLFAGSESRAFTVNSWSLRAISSLTLSSNLLFSERNWCKHDRSDAMSKCWAWSIMNWEPWDHWRSNSCSKVCG